MLIKEAHELGIISVGKRVKTNGDTSGIGDGIFSGRIVKVGKTDFDVLRDDGKTGCGVDGSWSIASLNDKATIEFEDGTETTNPLAKSSMSVLDFFRDLTATPNDKLLKELGIENPTNIPTELGLKLSQEITYAANRARIIEIALQMKADADAKKAA